MIPLAPDFEDPESNYPPYVFSSTPAVGEVITFNQTGNQTSTPEITVTVADPNRGDLLYVRWIFDYPKYDDNSRLVAWDANPVPPASNGGEVREPLRFAPSCSLHNIARGPTEHRLLLVVSDRPFINPDVARPPEYRLDAIPDGARRVRASWTLKLECR